MKIAICLLTCDRVALTADTVTTLVKHNDLSPYLLLHADDASKDRSVFPLIRTAGFTTVFQATRRQGVSFMTQLLFEAAHAEGADAVLNLQNDWRSLRELPLQGIIRLLQRGDVYCVRLCGPEKSPGRLFGTTHAAKDRNKIVEWTPVDDEFEVGDIHWGHPPCVTLIKNALYLTRNAGSESASRKRSGEIDKLTARPFKSIFMHTGDVSTEGFME